MINLVNNLKKTLQKIAIENQYNTAGDYFLIIRKKHLEAYKVHFKGHKNFAIQIKTSRWVETEKESFPHSHNIF